MRSSTDNVLARVFGLLESLDPLGLAVGSLLAPTELLLIASDHASRSSPSIPRAPVSAMSCGKTACHRR